MARKIRHILMAVLGGVFLFSVCFILVVQYEYRNNEKLYQGAAAQFTAAAPAGERSGGTGSGTEEAGSADTGSREPQERRRQPGHAGAGAFRGP